MATTLFEIYQTAFPGTWCEARTEEQIKKRLGGGGCGAGGEREEDLKGNFSRNFFRMDPNSGLAKAEVHTDMHTNAHTQATRS